MKNHHIALLMLALVLLLMAGFFLWQRHLQESQATKLNQALEQSNRQWDQSRIRIQSEWEERTKQAEEAARMLREQAERTEAQQQALIAQLNARLEAEAALREQTEEASATLQARMTDLEKSLREAEAKQAEFAQRLKEAGTKTAPVVAGAEEALAAQRAELARLEAERLRLEKAREEAIARQIELEETIMEAGGEINVRNYRVWSPNYRPMNPR